VRELREGKLLRVFVDEDDRYEGRPLHLAIVDALRSAGFTGATVLKGVEGFGTSNRLRAARAPDQATGLPVLIEVIDDETRIVQFLPVLKAMMQSGLVTLEKLQLLRLSKGPQ
jgi:uncharacterized protein